MTTIPINPGSGPVLEGSPEAAAHNVERLFADAEKAMGGEWAGVTVVPRGKKIVRTVDPRTREPIELPWDGRWWFDVTVDIGEDVEPVTFDIDMPGLPLDALRYTGAPGQDIWDYPRLYVDGSSWVWRYAIEVISATINGEE